MSEQTSRSAEVETLEAELARARESRRARTVARDQDVDLRKLRDQVATEKRLDELERATVEMEEKYGPLNRAIAIVHAVYADGHVLGSIIVRRPHHAIWKRLSVILDEVRGAKKSEEFDRLIWPHVVWPDKDRVEKYFVELPHAETKVVNALAALAGVGAEEVAGK